jgi:hypothetical protein
MAVAAPPTRSIRLTPVSCPCRAEGISQPPWTFIPNPAEVCAVEAARGNGSSRLDIVDGGAEGLCRHGARRGTRHRDRTCYGCRIPWSIRLRWPARFSDVQCHSTLRPLLRSLNLDGMADSPISLKSPPQCFIRTNREWGRRRIPRCTNVVLTLADFSKRICH